MDRVADLAIVIRCHRDPEYVLDTVDAVFLNSTTKPLVAIAADNNRDIAPVVKKAYPQVYCYSSSVSYGWGAGLYTLLLESMEYLERRGCLFKHFLSIDYDAVPIRKGADAALLDLVQDGVGLIGSLRSSAHWSKLIELSKQQFYRWGLPADVKINCKASVLGAVMLITRPCINAMRAMGFFEEPIRSPKKSCNIADDAWLSFLTQASGFKLLDIGNVGHVVWSNPIDPQLAAERKYFWFHPVKMRAGGSRQRQCAPEEHFARNFFRSLRNRAPLDARMPLNTAYRVQVVPRRVVVSPHISGRPHALRAR